MPIQTKTKPQTARPEPVYNRIVIGTAILVIFIATAVIIGSWQKASAPEESSSNNITPNSQSNLELRVESSGSLSSTPTGSLLQGSTLGSDQQDSQSIQSSQSPQSLPATPDIQGSRAQDQPTTTP